MNSPDIIFPNIGITIENLDRVAFTVPILGFSIHWYGIFIAIGVLSGISIALWNVKRMGGDVNLYVDFTLIVVPACIIGTRLFYVIFNWDHYRRNLMSILDFRAGLAIYGAIIAAFLTALIFTKIKKISFFKFADLGIIGLPLGQAIGRWGNFTNREAFGGFTDGLFAMQYRFSDVSSGMIGGAQDIIENFVYIDGVRYIQVHPTFFYESMWNFATVIILYVFMKHKKFDGQIAAMYLLLYGIGRFWIEGLRTDSLMLGSNIPVSQALSGVVAIAAAGFIIVNLVLKFRKKEQTQGVDLNESM